VKWGEDIGSQCKWTGGAKKIMGGAKKITGGAKKISILGRGKKNQGRGKKNTSRGKKIFSHNFTFDILTGQVEVGLFWRMDLSGVIFFVLFLSFGKNFGHGWLE